MHYYYIEWVLMLWEYCEPVHIPLSSLQQVWVTTSNIASASTRHSSSVREALRLDTWTEIQVNIWVVLAHGHGMACILMLWDSMRVLWNCVYTPAILQWACVRIVALTFTSMSHSSSICGALTPRLECISISEWFYQYVKMLGDHNRTSKLNVWIVQNH